MTKLEKLKAARDNAYAAWAKADAARDKADALAEKEAEIARIREATIKECMACIETSCYTDEALSRLRTLLPPDEKKEEP